MQGVVSPSILQNKKEFLQQFATLLLQGIFLALIEATKNLPWPEKTFIIQQVFELAWVGIRFEVPDVKNYPLLFKNTLLVTEISL